MGTLIKRQDAILAVCKTCMVMPNYYTCPGYQEGSTWCEEVTALRQIPYAQPGGVVEQHVDEILQAGKEGREFRFYIGGRLFAIRELAQ